MGATENIQEPGGPGALRARIRRGSRVFGVWSIMPYPTVCEIIAFSGFDFVIHDMEHGFYDAASLEACIRATQGAGCGSIVRTPGLSHSATQWALDVGANGIIVPQVANAVEAGVAVSYAKYPPIGIRGFNPFTRSGGYGKAQSNEVVATDASVITGIIVENTAALDDIDRILEVEALDLVYLGAYDLSVALGCPGDIRAPQVVKVIGACVEKVRRAGKAAGMMVRSASDVQVATDFGATVLLNAVDTGIVRDAFADALGLMKTAARS